MEDQAPNSVFSYLGQEIMQQQLVDITHSIQQCFDPGTAQFNSLGAYSKKLNQKREKWPDKIYQTWQNRKFPIVQRALTNEHCACFSNRFCERTA